MKTAKDETLCKAYGTTKSDMLGGASAYITGQNFAVDGGALAHGY